MLLPYWSITAGPLLMSDSRAFSAPPGQSRSGSGCTARNTTPGCADGITPRTCPGSDAAGVPHPRARPDQGGRETSLSIERRGAADPLVPIINGNGGLPRAHQRLGRQTQQEFDHWMHPDRNIEGLAGVALPGRSGRSVCGLTARPTPGPHPPQQRGCDLHNQVCRKNAPSYAIIAAITSRSTVDRGTKE